MPSSRILSARATVKRDQNAGPGATGSGAYVPDYQPIATDRPFAPAQPMTDVLRRKLPGDVAATDYYSICGINEDVREGDVIVLDRAYRVESARRWTSGSARAQHVDLGLRVAD